MVNSLTMDIWILLANVLAIAVIFVIIVYLWLDKKRFRVERQFRAAADLFDEWMALSANNPSCAESVQEYRSTKNISKKYAAIYDVSQAVWGEETPEMKSIAGELSVFLGVYGVLAEEYNRRLNSKFTGPLAKFLGFKKFPNIQMEMENVQN